MFAFIEMIRTLPTPFDFALMIVLIVFGAGLITTLIKQVRKFASHRQELEFKREMVDRGMSVEEVERLLMAQSKTQADD